MAAAGKGSWQQGAPKWPEVRARLHMRIKDVSAELNVPVTYLRHLCHMNGYPHWPGKQVRYMNGVGRNIMLEVEERLGSSWAGIGMAGRSSYLVAKMAQVQRKKRKKDEEMAKIHQAPDANPPPPGQELTTLNLLDKVGSSSSFSSSSSSSKRN